MMSNCAQVRAVLKQTGLTKYAEEFANKLTAHAQARVRHLRSLRSSELRHHSLKGANS